jgi:NAD(P)-dependent dehydrogenase (short-subunit alcohol dehydrogenase family)
MISLLGPVSRPDLPLAIVVGAGDLGTAVARRMAQAYQVLLADIDARAAADRARELGAEGGEVSSIVCDVTDPASVASLAEAVAQAGGFRTLVHVAGLSIAAGAFDRIVQVNLRGPALVVQALLPYARIGSSAILIASLAAHSQRLGPELIEVLADPAAPDIADRLACLLRPDATNAAMAYTLSKCGLLEMARRQAPAWGAAGARIVSLSPGLIATSMGALSYEKSAGKRAMLEQSPLGRECSMLEIADAVEFLASTRASFISGTDLLVDGGLAAALGYPL